MRRGRQPGARHTVEGEGGWDGTGLSLPPSLCSHVDTKELCGKCPALRGPGLGCRDGTRGSDRGPGGTWGAQGGWDPSLTLTFAFSSLRLLCGPHGGL